jgi:hypothetical protein
MPEDFSFRIQSDEIISIEPADLQSPVVSFFDLPFTRIRAKCPAPLDSFLICVGGRIAMPSIKARSRELREQLMRWSTASADSSH